MQLVFVLVCLQRGQGLWEPGFLLCLHICRQSPRPRQGLPYWVYKTWCGGWLGPGTFLASCVWSGGWGVCSKQVQVVVQGLASRPAVGVTLVPRVVCGGCSCGGPVGVKPRIHMPPWSLVTCTAALNTLLHPGGRAAVCVLCPA